MGIYIAMKYSLRKDIYPTFMLYANEVQPKLRRKWTIQDLFSLRFGREIFFCFICRWMKFVYIQIQRFKSGYTTIWNSKLTRHLITVKFYLRVNVFSIILPWNVFLFLSNTLAFNAKDKANLAK